MKNIAIYVLLTLSGMHIVCGDEATRPAKTIEKITVSLWCGVVPLKNKQVLSVKLELYADKSALLTESIYKNWGHYNNKRKPLSVVTQKGSFKEVTRIPSKVSTAANGEPFIDVTVVGLQIGDWKVDYGERKGNTIMRYDKQRYAATLMLSERTQDNK